MQLRDITYFGPAVDDPEILAELPSELAELLGERNGFIAFGGGLHLRGASRQPQWHSLRQAWQGPQSLASRYSVLLATDIPFAQDALGDQYVLRNDRIHKLDAEVGDLAALDISLAEFLAATAADPIGFLALAPLLEFQNEGGRLAPGELLNVYPPYCVKADGPGRSYRAIPAADRLGFLASLASQIAKLPDGTPIEFRITS